MKFQIMKSQDQLMRINMKNKFITKQDIFEILEIVITAIFSIVTIYILTIIFWSYQ